VVFKIRKGFFCIQQRSALSKDKLNKRIFTKSISKVLKQPVFTLLDIIPLITKERKAVQAKYIDLPIDGQFGQDMLQQPDVGISNFLSIGSREHLVGIIDGMIMVAHDEVKFSGIDGIGVVHYMLVLTG